jgi:hypothetical protein
MEVFGTICAFILAIFAPRTCFAIVAGILSGFHWFAIVILAIGGVVMDIAFSVS